MSFFQRFKEGVMEIYLRKFRKHNIETPRRKEKLELSGGQLDKKVTETLCRLSAVKATAEVIPLEQYTSEMVNNVVDDLNNKQENKEIDINPIKIKSMLNQVRSELKNNEVNSCWTKAYKVARENLGSIPHPNQLIGAYLIVEGNSVIGDESRPEKPLFLDFDTEEETILLNFLTNWVLSQKFDTIVNLTAYSRRAQTYVDHLKETYFKMGKEIATMDKEGKLVTSEGEDVTDLNEADVIYAGYKALVLHVLRRMADNDFNEWESLNNMALIVDGIHDILTEQLGNPAIISRDRSSYYGIPQSKEFFRLVGKYAKSASLKRKERVKIEEMLEVFRKFNKGEITFQGLIKSGVIPSPSSIIEENTEYSVRQLVKTVLEAPRIVEEKAGKYIVEEIEGERQIILVSDIEAGTPLTARTHMRWMNWDHELIEASEGLKVHDYRGGGWLEVLTAQKFILQFGLITGYSPTAYEFSELLSSFCKDAETVSIPKTLSKERNDHIFGYKSEEIKREDMMTTAIKSASHGNSVLLTTRHDKIEGFVCGLKSIIRALGLEVRVCSFDAHDCFSSLKKELIEKNIFTEQTITVTTPMLTNSICFKKETPLVMVIEGLFSETFFKQVACKAYQDGIDGATFTFFNTEHLRSQAEFEEELIHLIREEIGESEGKRFAFDECNILKLQQSYTKEIKEGLEGIEEYDGLIEFEISKEKPFYIRSLLEVIKDKNENIDSIGLYDKFKKYVGSFNKEELNRIISNSPLLTKEEKDNLLEFDLSNIELIDDYLDEKFPNVEERKDLLSSMLEEHMSFYKRIVLNNKNNPDCDSLDGLIQDAYQLYRIRIIHNLLTNLAEPYYRGGGFLTFFQRLFNIHQRKRGNF